MLPPFHCVAVFHMIRHTHFRSPIHVQTHNDALSHAQLGCCRVQPHMVLMMYHAVGQRTYMFLHDALKPMHTMFLLMYHTAYDIAHTCFCECIMLLGSV